MSGGATGTGTTVSALAKQSALTGPQPKADTTPLAPWRAQLTTVVLEAVVADLRERLKHPLPADGLVNAANTDVLGVAGLNTVSGIILEAGGEPPGAAHRRAWSGPGD